MNSNLRNHEASYIYSQVANEAWSMRLGVDHKIIQMNLVATLETTEKLPGSCDPPSNEDNFQLHPISALLFHRGKLTILMADRTLLKACQFSDFLFYILAISSLDDRIDMKFSRELRHIEFVSCSDQVRWKLHSKPDTTMIYTRWQFGTTPKWRTPTQDSDIAKEKLTSGTTKLPSQSAPIWSPYVNTIEQSQNSSQWLLNEYSEKHESQLKWDCVLLDVLKQSQAAQLKKHTLKS